MRGLWGLNGEDETEKRETELTKSEVGSQIKVVRIGSLHRKLVCIEVPKTLNLD